MTETPPDPMMIRLRQAVNGSRRPRSLARAIDKGLPVVLELRAESTWAEIAGLFKEAGLSATAESIRRTVRREQARRSKPAAQPPASAQTTDAMPPEALERTSSGPAPVARATGPPGASAPWGGETAASTVLITGGAMLDQINRFKDMNK